MSQKVVINRCYGGFSLSYEAFLRLRELGCKTALEETDVDGKPEGGILEAFCRDIARDDPLFLQVIDELGLEETSGELAELAVVEIPDGVEWVIGEYDGMEQVEEAHRSWQ